MSCYVLLTCFCFFAAALQLRFPLTRFRFAINPTHASVTCVVQAGVPLLESDRGSFSVPPAAAHGASGAAAAAGRGNKPATFDIEEPAR